MFEIGDVIVYSAHGLCRIDDICERTLAGETRTYYVMHPLGDDNLTISCPVDSNKVKMLKTLERDEAEKVLQSFKEPGVEWIDDYRKRNAKYKEWINSADRMLIAKVINTLMRRDKELQANNKQLYEVDRRMLADIQQILFKELALTLGTTYEEILRQAEEMIENYPAPTKTS